MATLPEIAIQAWESREGPVVLTTVDSSGIPNPIDVTCVKKISDSQIVVADNKLKRSIPALTNSPDIYLFCTTIAGAYDRHCGHEVVVCVRA